MIGHSRWLLSIILGAIVPGACANDESDDAADVSSVSEVTGSQENGTSGSGDPTTTVDGSEGAGAGGACGEEDECRTAQDCEPGHLCLGCSCCDPGDEGNVNLECGDMPPPGRDRCVDEPDSMFVCLPGLECCGSKEACYDPTREPDFCPEG